MNSEPIRPTPETDAEAAPGSAAWYRKRADEVRHNGKTVTQYNHFLGIADAIERERDAVREELAEALAAKQRILHALFVLKSDVDHLGHWIPDPCRRLVEDVLPPAPDGDCA